ncbi:ribonucleoside-diphosphate reductase class Ib glutaredoxin subunit [Leucobacter luti]|uniref:Ribonucleoside-diphosphate reductase class Ib glutaredoxin subunit n=1 Tax=Leucobacter luti TaxID=340320 RepID=A0A4R6RRR9_9MICO|nr:glutaredoxin domain-containing protein [Leucobacter luti]TDP89523.1 ribonucleoside-diphosphate reductase class Ib glutaredoxin subunit [Leucobacter luti]
MATFTVYSTPRCQQCKATSRELESLNIPFDYIDITTDEASAKHARSLGYTGAPVVVAPNGEHWTGFRPDKIQEHAKELATV